MSKKSPFFVNVGDPKPNFALIWLKSETSITEEKNDTSDTNYFKQKKTSLGDHVSLDSSPRDQARCGSVVSHVLWPTNIIGYNVYIYISIMTSSIHMKIYVCWHWHRIVCQNRTPFHGGWILNTLTSNFKHIESDVFKSIRLRFMHTCGEMCKSVCFECVFCRIHKHNPEPNAQWGGDYHHIQPCTIGI